MKYDAKNDSFKLGEYNYSVEKKMLKEAHRKKVGYKTKFIIIIIFISILTFIFYPFDLERTAGIKNLTADDISNITLEQTITIPKGMDIETKDISMDDIGEELEELRPLPISKYSEIHSTSMKDITDKNFIEEVLLTLSNHNMRKRRFSKGGTTFRVDYTMPGSTRVTIRLNDDNKTGVHIFISHDPRYVSLYTFSSNGSSDRARYKIYGDGIDTQKLFELTRKFK
ncbi:hypothetical protein [Alkaliphilus peptidifermentans]|uniref:Uncharacterized protein n=1 Tax=Alkaliphilus peptidifermentans DSM 18978 TaxID=1120976 RepID=A0A1G5GU92_9FIRM|nr:hypothetical protein [Alkaliphilus peptidifermentans]SCY55172.1 hypothetical protein SAMN03080606_01783 [Alkaliphilus peptidifermentans DSM 18978]